MTTSTPVGALDARDQKRQDTLDQIELTRRLVTVAAIRAEVDDNPNLTAEQCLTIDVASDGEIQALVFNEIAPA